MLKAKIFSTTTVNALTSTTTTKILASLVLKKTLFMWGPVISRVLLRLYGMGLQPNDPNRGY